MRRSGHALRAAHALVGLYPVAWRARYGEEMHALLDDDPPGVRGLASLLRAAAGAHLHPGAVWRAAAGAEARMGASISGMFACWIALSLAGVAFQRETEDPPFRDADSHHALLGVAHGAVIAGAVLGAGVIALAGLPLLWRALLRAYAARDLRLALAIGLAPAAVACFALLTALILLLRDHTREASLALSAPWFAAGLACALACALAPRLTLLRMHGPSRTFARASHLGIVLALAMALVSGGMVAYAAALARLSPSLWSMSTGPHAASASTGVVLAGASALAALSAALGAVGAARARRAAGAHI
jgi:hypothetical protein